MSLVKVRGLFGQKDNLAAGGKLRAFYYADTYADIPVTGLNPGDEFYCGADGVKYTAFTATTVGAVGGPGTWAPAMNGALLAASMPPQSANTNTAALASGTENWTKLYLGPSRSVTNILIEVQTAGATLTAGQCFAGVYSISGTTATQVGITADQSGVWNSTGLKTMALVSGPFSVPGPYCYVCILSNGTTGPILKGGNNLGASGNMGMVAADGYWAATGSTLQTAMPASRLFAAMGNSGASILVGLT